jgi:hypothetical protein
MAGNNLKFEGPADPNNLIQVDEFLWRGSVVTRTYEHTKVLWKGSHILTIKKHVDWDYPIENRDGVLGPDEEDDEPPHVDPKKEPEVKWLLHAHWEWIKFNYGEYEGLFAAREAATKEVEVLATNIRKAFALRPIKED